MQQNSSFQVMQKYGVYSNMSQQFLLCFTGSVKSQQSDMTLLLKVIHFAVCFKAPVHQDWGRQNIFILNSLLFYLLPVALLQGG